MSEYTPREVSIADQNLAAINHRLDDLIATANPALGADIAELDALGALLLATVDPAGLAVALAIAVHRLAAAR